MGHDHIRYLEIIAQTVFIFGTKIEIFADWQLMVNHDKAEHVLVARQQYRIAEEWRTTKRLSWIR